MKLVPVLDLMAGQVVHARHGVRENYQPIRSTLCPGTAPEAILRALVETFACDTIYIADLDAIRFGRPQLRLIERLKTRFPNIELWLDAGISGRPSFEFITGLGLGPPVIGSESLLDAIWLEALERDAWILSLDFKQGDFLGPAPLLAHPPGWPNRVVAMNLARVGSDLGPDFGLLEMLRLRRPDCSLFAAGGVRNKDDLMELKRRGIAGALVATALHSGGITSADQSSIYENEKPPAHAESF